MAKTDYRSIDEYHQGFSGDILQRMQTLRELVHKTAPEVEEVISYQIPAFKLGKKFMIYYSAYARHLALSNPWTQAFLNKFAKELKVYKVSKSVIQFPNDQPLPLEFIKRILEFRKKEIEASDF